ncbi:MAG: hypothetical protein D6771_06330 [Zetaproteobacteria bacterium]|nr:MAG: hypothetical protein D6771_06330 [Zetaproteobacteria bacterium]
MPQSVVLVLASFVWMGMAYLARRRRALHAGMMGAVAAFDLAFPVYLYLTHDWWRRLIEQQEILSFLVWAHFGLGLLLYTLHFMQIRAGLRLWRGDQAARGEHRQLALGLLAARIVVFTTGAFLIEPGGS